MKIAIVAVVIAAALFTAGILIGYRLAAKPDAVTNSMLQEKIEHEAADLRGRIDSVGSKVDRTNFLLMHAMGPNVAGVIGSAIAAGFLISMFGG